ncbi:phage antirepressor KilAC domain-containing protein, partial [Staphylococcus aureus]
TQKSMDLKILDIKKRIINNPDGSSKVSRTPKVTGKGQQYFVNKFLGVKQTS